MMTHCWNKTSFLQQARYELLCGILIASGCSASTRLSHLAVDQAAQSSFRYIHLDVDLADAADTPSLTNAMIRELDRYDLEIIPTTQQRKNRVPFIPVQPCSQSGR